MGFGVDGSVLFIVIMLFIKKKKNDLSKIG